MTDHSQAMPVDLGALDAAPLDPALPRRGDGPTKRLYRWTMGLAETRHAPLALGLIAFAESSFFPVPPDVIGALLYGTVGHWLIHLYGYDARIPALQGFFAQWGWAFILMKGLTPIPFKLVTIFCGLVGYDLPLFLLLCAVTRGARFFVLAVLLTLFGERIKRLLERYFGAFVIVLALTVVAGFVIAAKVI